jgi:hypothetical protein
MLMWKWSPQTCPNCTIYLIEANGEDQTDLQTANATAVSLGAHILNDAWGCNGSGCVDKSYFGTKGVTYVALGAVPQPDEIYPADFDTVVAVGGTYLTQGGGGKRGWTEKVWHGAGGGCFYRRSEATVAEGNHLLRTRFQRCLDGCLEHCGVRQL